MIGTGVALVLRWRRTSGVGAAGGSAQPELLAFAGSGKTLVLTNGVIGGSGGSTSSSARPMTQRQPSKPPPRSALYRMPDGSWEKVVVLKEHEDVEGTFTIYIPSLKRERQTISEQLDFGPARLMTLQQRMQEAAERRALGLSRNFKSPNAQGKTKKVTN